MGMVTAIAFFWSNKPNPAIGSKIGGVCLVFRVMGLAGYYGRTRRTPRHDKKYCTSHTKHNTNNDTTFVPRTMP
jgi:hypothetical protein